MGEAKRRADAFKRAKADLFAGIAGDERALVVANTALAFYERFILPKRYTGGCYLTTMFLHRVLKDEHSITTDPVVGYVNDGTDNIMISHSWIELDGRKTDVTLSLVDPNISMSGGLLILDTEIVPGRVRYGYYHQMTAAGEEANAALIAAGMGGLLRHKQQEHRIMLGMMADPKRMADHHSAAPSGLGYDEMRAALP
ncbi:hypothetical protein QH494_19590 [Sphingomonas sp. AR_OL41]|uniref:hypothetical protein n=1 Tax=Sphingomonas sp. AR_OL41 TaxID=3042729 RepID=UPI00248064AA|nr:hypothetical protein [Sphingomonas sp. AR_OL41]MDH7974399.1 hypothetical protein [Sphingomonas sp. AR_OL41]